MKERRYDLYGDVKCIMCLEENEDDDHLIYYQQLKDKWLMVANNIKHKCSNQELPIPFIHLMLRNFFPKKRYRKLKSIVKSEKAKLTITTLFLEIFINEFYRIIWQPYCNLQVEGDTYDLKGRQILKHNEQWSIALEKIRQYVNQFIREGNRRVVKAHTEAI
ncbi:hypothetical protein RhiirA5_436236 [Rhizophagus irregularis]|uniref:Uncharacterized protein n=1 Tax=Rhizophagus irregularis TaxID=588596 RepID=A0A2N0NM80_9GLOM|nr:hypothetical protein RhiirA5_436236 [Rhizophagus irregularis]